MHLNLSESACLLCNYVTHWIRLPCYCPHLFSKLLIGYDACLYERHRLVPVTCTGSLGYMQISQLTSLILRNQSNGQVHWAATSTSLLSYRAFYLGFNCGFFNNVRRFVRVWVTTNLHISITCRVQKVTRAWSWRHDRLQRKDVRHCLLPTDASRIAAQRRSSIRSVPSSVPKATYWRMRTPT